MKNWDLKIQFEYETADLDENGFKLRRKKVVGAKAAKAIIDLAQQICSA